LSLGVILNPGFGISTLVLLLSTTLLVVGIERVVTGFTKSNRSSTQNPKEKKIINT
jgi:uncharacterized membrane protein HdeD (DUF308 family)